MYKNLENYLKEASRYLVSDNPQDILEEIRGHVLEKAGEYGEVSEDTIGKALAAMGSPRTMAANFAEGKEIIAPDLRNYLFLYTSVLFAIHFGAVTIASIAGISIAVFPLFYAPPAMGLVGMLFFLPFAFVLDFGLVSLTLFAVSQWFPDIRLPMPEVAQKKHYPSAWVLLAQLAGFAGFAAIWHFHPQLVEALQGSKMILTLPTQVVFLPPTLVLAVGAATTAIHLLTKSRLVPALGALVTLVGLWLLGATPENPAFLVATRDPWGAFNINGYRGLLILLTILVTIELVKSVVTLVMAIQWKGEVAFRPAGNKDWINTVLRLVLYITGIVIGGIVILPRYPVLWFAIVLLGLLFLVRWHNTSFGFRCRKCGNEFEISTFLNLISPHGVWNDKEGKYGWKWLRCPKCRKFSAARVVKKDR